jgi:hypothetical protein
VNVPGKHGLVLTISIFTETLNAAHVVDRLVVQLTTDLVICKRVLVRNFNDNNNDNRNRYNNNNNTNK